MFETEIKELTLSDDVLPVEVCKNPKCSKAIWKIILNKEKLSFSSNETFLSPVHPECGAQSNVVSSDAKSVYNIVIREAINKNTTNELLNDNMFKIIKYFMLGINAQVVNDIYILVFYKYSEQKYNKLIKNDVYNFENHPSLNVHIIYFNLSYKVNKKSESKYGKEMLNLLHDFQTADPNDIIIPELKNEVEKVKKKKTGLAELLFKRLEYKRGYELGKTTAELKYAKLEIEEKDNKIKEKDIQIYEYQKEKQEMISVRNKSIFSLWENGVSIDVLASSFGLDKEKIESIIESSKQ